MGQGQRIWFRLELGRVFGRLLDEGFVTETVARDAASKILSENAHRLYGF